MKLKILQGNMFEFPADAIILGFDGSAAGLGGRLARAFATAFPEAGRLLQSSIAYPVAAGDFRVVTQPGKLPFSRVYLASVLRHTAVDYPGDSEAIYCAAYIKIVRDAAIYNSAIISTGLPSGGWRNRPLNAFDVLARVMERTFEYTRGITLQLCILEPDIYYRVKHYATSTGYENI